MIDVLDDGNWAEVFHYSRPTPVIGSPIELSLAPFTREDVKRAIALVDGENDETSWVGVFELNDGRFVSIAAWCDYTGWG